MKKFIVTIVTFALIAITCAAYVSTGGGVSAAADTANEVRTEIFSPSTYLEYCELSGPYDFRYNEATNTYAIAEADRIIIYTDDKFKEYDMTGYNISEIRFYGDNYLAFASTGILYTVKIDEWTDSSSAVSTSLAATSFDVYGDTFIMSAGNSFIVAQATVSDSGFEFTKTTTYKEDISFNAIAAISETQWYCVNEGSLYLYNSNNNGSYNKIASNLNDTRYGCYGDGVYYATCQDGVYSVDLTQGAPTAKLIIGTKQTEELGNIISPQGISYYNGKIYVTDHQVNAVSEIDPDAKAFTGYYISARSEGAGRVSTAAADITANSEYVYALDKGQIKAVEYGGSEKPVLDMPVSGTYKAFAVSDDNVLLINGNDKICAVKLSGEKAEYCEISEDLAEIGDPCAITAFDGTFYILNNDIQGGVVVTEVYALDAENFSGLEKVTQISGTGENITADIYGKLYVQLKNGNERSVVSVLPANSESAKEVFRTEYEVLSIAVDFECNIYVLTENNCIVRVDEDGNAEEFTLVLSDNLPTSATAKDIAIVPATEDMYALYDGFILKINSEDLKIASPFNIAVPDGYENAFDDGFVLCKITVGSRYFEIDISATDGEYFEYVGYSTYIGSEEFAVLDKGDKYTLVANDNLVAVVRTQDITDYAPNYTEADTDMFVTVNAHMYTYPVLMEYFRITSLDENQSVNTVKTFTFNGTEFAVIETEGGENGFLPLSVMKTNVAIDDSPYECYYLAVGNKGANVYSESTLYRTIGRLNAYETVKIYGVEDGAYKIYYNGEVAYISANDVEDRGKIKIRNFVLVSIAVLAVVITVVFFYRRKYNKKSSKNTTQK